MEFIDEQYTEMADIHEVGLMPIKHLLLQLWSSYFM